MNKRILRLSLLILVLSIAIVMVAGCSSRICIEGNLSSDMSVAKVEGTQSDPISMIDCRSDTKWKGDAHGDTPVIAIFNFSDVTTFNTIVFDEDGTKISGIEIFVKDKMGAESWRSIYKGNYLPEDGVLTFESVATTQLKVVISDSDGKFAIREMGVYNEEYLD